MNPNAAGKGRSFKGAIAYIIHDPDQAETDERVLFTETRNLRTDDPEKAAKVMAYTALHASELKAQAGIKATGRKTDCPVYHLSLSWVPGERPTQAEMMGAGEAALQALGYAEHEAVYAAHGDKAHQHLHVVVNRVHPGTGKTHNPKDDQKLLQAWAHEYDKARGLEHRSPDRAARFELDPVKRAEYKAAAAAAREKAGAANDNTGSRPVWNATREATHPKSSRYKEITTHFKQRADELANASRALYRRQTEERSALRARQKEQWAALRPMTKERAAFAKASGGFGKSKLQTAFDKAGSARKGSRGHHAEGFQEIKASQRIERRQLEAEQRARSAAFERNEAHTGKTLAATLHAVSHTPVGQHGPEHRGHLAAGFEHAAGRNERAALAGLAAHPKNLAELEARYDQQYDTLRGRLRTARAPADHRKTLRQRRTALSAEQRGERKALREAQHAERRDLQGRWASLNDDRTQAWEAYRVQRSDQAAAKTVGQSEDRSRAGDAPKDIFATRSSGLYESRRIEGRDAGSAPTEGGGRQISRKGPG